MHAAALGNLDVVKAIHELRPLFEVRNKLTKANLLHYAAQQPKGGADIIKWVILHEKASDDLLNQQILVLREERETDKDWDRGNGHTVAFEAVFNNNVGVVEALIEIENQGHKVDFTTPAVHGPSPLGWALNNDSNRSWTSSSPTCVQIRRTLRHRERKTNPRGSTLKGRMTSGDRAILKMSPLLTSRNNCASTL